MNARSTPSFLAALLATASLLSAACGPKPESATGTAAPTPTAPSDPTPAPSEPTPVPAPPDDEPVPDAKAPETQGVSVTVKLGDKSTTLALSKAILEARGQGPVAMWDCNAKLGSVGVTDFVIGDDPAKKGELFVIRIDRSGLSRLVPGQESKARLRFRRAGETTLTSIDGVATWDADLLSGVARGQTPDGVDLEARWTCAPSVTP